MAHTVIMPKLGQTVEESTILKWHKKAGDPVKKGEILFEIETDKAVLEVESFVEGTLLKILVREGETVPVTAPVAFVGQPGEALPEVKPLQQRAPQAAQSSTPPPGSRPPDRQPAAAAVSPAPAAHPAPASPILMSRKAISPRARRLAKDCAINAEAVDGTGPGARVTEKDVREYLAAKHYAEIRITPAAKALAVREGIDILGVETEKGAMISTADIERKAAEKPREMSKMRQVIAQRLTKSFTSVPHFYVTVAIDMTDLLAFRKMLKRENKPFSVTDFILKACAGALVEFPAVNSTTDGKAVRWNSRVNLGVAVEIKEGLVVPVIRNAGAISLAELHEQAALLVARAREGKLAPDDMSGGTFTVSNMGMLNVDNFTAIINPGESAILAVGSIIPTPAAVKDEIKIRSIMKATVSSDHRLVDGATAARFINRIKDQLEDTQTWTNMI